MYPSANLLWKGTPLPKAFSVWKVPISTIAIRVSNVSVAANELQQLKWQQQYPNNVEYNASNGRFNVLYPGRIFRFSLSKSQKIEHVKVIGGSGWCALEVAGEKRSRKSSKNTFAVSCLIGFICFGANNSRERQGHRCRMGDRRRSHAKFLCN